MIKISIRLKTANKSCQCIKALLDIKMPSGQSESYTQAEQDRPEQITLSPFLSLSRLKGRVKIARKTAFKDCAYDLNDCIAG